MKRYDYRTGPDVKLKPIMQKAVRKLLIWLIKEITMRHQA